MTLEKGDNRNLFISRVHEYQKKVLVGDFSS